jgi:transcription initiation factor TFIID subunit TAF12
MVNTPPQQQRQHQQQQQQHQQQQQQQQQQQHQQQQKRKKTIGAITLADTSFPPGFAPVLDTPVLDALEGSVSEFSRCDEYMDASNEDMDASNEGKDVRTVSFANKTKITEQVATSSKPAPWHFGSDELDLDKWQIQKNKRSQKPTYSDARL